MPLVKTLNAWVGPMALYLAGGTVCVATLAIGGVRASAHVGLAALALVALLLHIVDRARERRPLVVPWTVTGLLLALGATALTLVPLPFGLRLLLDPRSTDLKTWIGEGLSAEARELILPVLAVDPPEAALSLLRLVGAICLFLVVADRARRRVPRDRLFRLLVGGGVLVLAVGVFHRIANLDAIYGVVETGADSLLRAPLVNPNHLARVLGAFSLLALSYLASVRQRTEQVAVAAAAALLGAGVFLTYSRGGMLAYATVAVLVAMTWLLMRGGDAAPAGTATRGSAAVPLMAFVGIGFALWAAREALVSELTSLGGESVESSKANLYGPALRLIGEHPWVGVGPGGFRTAMPALLDVGELNGLTYTHVENVILETLVSHGVLLGTGILAVGGATAWHLLRRLPSPALRGTLFVLAFLLLGDLSDFVLQIPAGLYLAAVTLGLASAAAVSESAPAWRIQPRPALAALVSLVVVSGVAGTVAITQDRRALDSQLNALSSEAQHELAERAIAHHPLDPWYAYLLSRNARVRRSPEDAMTWANRAIILDPNSGPAHVEAARVLWADGRIDQALTEYRLAWASTNTPWRRLIGEVASRSPELEIRLKAVPADDPRGRLEVCRRISHEKRHAVALACWEGAVLAFPDDQDFRRRAVGQALQLEQKEKARALLDPLLVRRPLDGGTAQLLAKTVSLEKGIEAAYAEAKALRPEVKSGTFALDWWLFTTARRLKYLSEAQSALQRARQTADRRQRLLVDEGEASLLEGMGDKGEALIRWRKIAAQDANHPQAALHQARLELDLGLLSHAELTLRSVRRRTPNAEALAKLEARLELMRGAPKPPLDPDTRR